MTDAEAIEDFIQRHGVTRCPPAYVAPVNGGTRLGDVPTAEHPLSKKRPVKPSLASKVSISLYWRGRKRS